jgi:hypothetical protein
VAVGRLDGTNGLSGLPDALLDDVAGSSGNGMIHAVVGNAGSRGGDPWRSNIRRRYGLEAAMLAGLNRT